MLSVHRKVAVIGQSGKEHHFDFKIADKQGRILLIDAVAPHPVSIYSKYVAFSDVSRDGGRESRRFAVYDRPLEPADVSLLQQVADLVPMESLEPGARRILMQ
jgi:hypothetical protein